MSTAAPAGPPADQLPEAPPPVKPGTIGARAGDYELGVVPVEPIFARVRWPMGLPGLARGQLVEVSGWQHYRLMFKQTSLLPVTAEEWRLAPVCGVCQRRWGSRELADGCEHGAGSAA